MSLLPFRNHRNPLPMDTGSLLGSKPKGHHLGIPDGELPTLKPPPLDEALLTEVTTNVHNGVTTRKDAEQTVADRHEHLCRSAFRAQTQAQRTETSTLESHLNVCDQREAELTTLREKTQKTIRKTESWYSMDWNPLDQVKFWVLCAGVLIAAGFGVINISRVLKANNLAYLDASWFSVIFVSLIFLCPILVIKQQYDSLPEHEDKDRYTNRLFAAMLVSFAAFIGVFCYVNMPQETPASLFEAAAVSSDPAPWLQYGYLLTQIILECTSAALLTVYATRVYEQHVHQTDTNEIHALTTSYQDIQADLDAVHQSKVLIRKRQELLDLYFEELEPQIQNYVTQAVTSLHTKIRSAS